MNKFVNNFGWIIYYGDGSPGEKIDIIPKNDLEDHYSDKCKCFPRIEQDFRNNGDIFYLITHNSYDRREKYEK